MVKINVSEDQNSVRINDSEYHEFYGYNQLPTGHMEDPCSKCSLNNYCEIETKFPCDDKRHDGVCGLFKKIYTGK